MKIFRLAVLLLVATNAWAGLETVAGSESPNKRYRISIEQTEWKIDYRIDTVAEGEVLLRIASSYQPDLGSDDWIRENSHGFEIHWRGDSRMLAIDEANYRNMGTVFFACRANKGFSLIRIDEKTLMAATKESWDRGRLFFVGWGKADCVILDIIGRIRAETSNRVERSRWQFKIDLGRGGKILSQRKVSIE